MWEKEERRHELVYVIEAIPVAGEHKIPAERMASERIPSPDHLRLSKEIGRGAVGRIHVALDRHLLRHVALKRLDGNMADVPSAVGDHLTIRRAG